MEEKEVRLYWEDGLAPESDLHWLFFERLSFSLWREIGIDVPSGGGESFFIRKLFQVPGKTFWREQALQLMKMRPNLTAPLCFHVGAAGTRESPYLSRGFKEETPIFKEFVLDIDLISEEFLKHRCPPSLRGETKALTIRHWPFIEAIVSSVKMLLVDSFGMDEQRILTVLSGARGIHIWVFLSTTGKHPLYQDMHRLDKEMRQTILDFIYRPFRESLPRWNNQDFQRRIVTYPAVCAQLEIFYSCLENMFLYDTLQTEEDMDWFSDTFMLEKEGNVREALQKRITFMRNPSQFHLSDEKAFPYRWLLWNFFSPRMDVKVTVELEHLIRMPFSPNQKTGNIAIPFDVPKQGQQRALFRPPFPLPNILSSTLSEDLKRPCLLLRIFVLRLKILDGREEGNMEF